MNSQEIKEILVKLLEDYDRVAPDFARAKANKDKMDELKKVTLATITAHSQGKSEAERTRNALKSQRYLEYIEAANSALLEYSLLEASKKKIEISIDVYRSLLSHEKTMVGLTT